VLIKTAQVYFGGPKIYFAKFWQHLSVCHLAALHLKTSKSKSFRAEESGLWWPRQG